MAPDRSVGAPRRPHQAHRLPRNHQAGHPRSHREATHGQHGLGQRPAGAPRPRPVGGFRALARAVEKGAAVALGRTRAVGRRAAHRRARARNHCVPVEALFPRRGPVLRRRRPRQDAFQGRAFLALRHAGAGRRIPARHRRQGVHGRQGRRKARPALSRTAVHHFDAPAGGRAQVGHVRFTNHVRGPAPLRAGSDYLHAYRFGQPFAAGAGPVQGGNHQALRRKILPLVQLQDQNQGGPGSPRSHPPLLHRPPANRGHDGRKTALRAYLEAHRRLADGLRRNRPHDGGHRHRGVAAPVHRHRRGSAVRRFSAALLRIDRRRPDRRKRRGAAAQDGAGRPAQRRRYYRHRTLHAGSGPLQRSLARQAARRVGHRPSVDLRPDDFHDHQPRLRGQAEQGRAETQLRATDARQRQGNGQDPHRKLRQGEKTACRPPT